MSYCRKKGRGKALTALALALTLLTGCAGATVRETFSPPLVTPTAEPTAEPTPSPKPTPSPTPGPTPEPEITAQDLIEQYFRDKKLRDDQIFVGYYNTGTGEEAYVNGDTYREAASMYKVALCMYWTEKIGRGELEWDQLMNGYRLNFSVEQTLVNSNNDTAGSLWSAIGSYKEYRRAMIPFYGGVPEEEEAAFCKSSAVTPRQMIHVLKMLYEDPDRYPRVLEFMLRASPNQYLRYKEAQPWTVAQKYGYFEGVVNICGIVYTEEPFLLVVMTKYVGKYQVYMSELCRLLGDYTEGRLPEAGDADTE